MDKESALFYVVLLLFAVTGIVTILGLVQKVAIEKRYLNALFAALILELVAAVLYMFSSTDFFSPGLPEDALVITKTQLPVAQRDFSAEELAGLLQMQALDRENLARAERELAELRSRIAAQVPPYDDVTLALDARIREIEQLRAEQQGFVKMRRNFLVRMADLNARISELGGTVNFDWQPAQKREIAGMLQSAFKQIGFMAADEQPDDDPARALRLLIDYQQSKRFGTTGFLTSQVVALIILDYLSPVSSNGSGFRSGRNTER